MFDLGMTPSLPTGCDWGVRIWISRLLPCILAKLVLIDLTKKRTEKKTLLLAQLIQIQSKLTASMCVSLFDGKNDRKNSGGTLRQKFNLIDIWHLIFDIWHMTFDIWYSTNGPMLLLTSYFSSVSSISFNDFPYFFHRLSTFPCQIKCWILINGSEGRQSWW